MAGPTIAKIPKRKKFSTVKNSEEKRMMANDAAFTMKRFAEIKREIREIKADKPLFEAARAILKQEVADLKSGMKT
jgi:hypothetical protein